MQWLGCQPKPPTPGTAVVEHGWAARKSVLLKMPCSKTASKHGAMVLHGQVPWATAVDWHPRALWLAGLFGRPPGAESGCPRFYVVY